MLNCTNKKAPHNHTQTDTRLTLDTVRGWLKSLPPISRNPQGAGPSSTTLSGMSLSSASSYVCVCGVCVCWINTGSTVTNKGAGQPCTLLTSEGGDRGEGEERDRPHSEVIGQIQGPVHFLSFSFFLFLLNLLQLTFSFHLPL